MPIHPLPQDVRTKLRSTISISSFSQCILELIENSIDAHSSNVEVNVDVQNYFIEISDDGWGIEPEDLEYIGNRYATSKCKELGDLQSITTYGFRGEALASISAIALLEVSSRHKEYLQSYYVISKGGKILSRGPTASIRDRGTTVIVRDLFYSVGRPFLAKSLVRILNSHHFRSISLFEFM
ncbi:histidine kinase-like ATPase, partial [Paraphysoderma sedebokerense]